MLRRRDVLVGAGSAAFAAQAVGRARRHPDGIPTGLMVDLRHTPAGVPADAARFSWLPPATAIGRQRAFQIQASEAIEELLANRPQRDTGRVTSAVSASAQLLIPIVQRGRHTYWRVRTWDAEDNVSGWSSPQPSSSQWAT